MDKQMSTSLVIHTFVVGFEYHKDEYVEVLYLISIKAPRAWLAS